MLSAFTNSFKIPELRQRILFTAAIIFLCRVIARLPAPGVNVAALGQALAAQTQNGGGFIGMFNMFSGGALQNAAIGALGIMPYISASIILQLMTAVVPVLERLSREGDTGRQKITQYTRYLTVILCVVQSFAMSKVLLSGVFGVPVVMIESPVVFVLLTIITMTTATMLLMWLGEQITERGIGNGISLIITINIVSGMPLAVRGLFDMFWPADGIPTHSPFLLVLLLAIMVIVIVSVIAITQAQRKIPIQYAKRVVGNKTYGGQSNYMPLRVNYSGVMPIIFAQAILMFPGKIFQMLEWNGLANAFSIGSGWYIFVYTLMILFFSYFWVSTQFNPVQIADDLKKGGGYVPGIRPGLPTAEFLDKTMTRITLAGAVFLTVIAVLPMLLGKHLDVPSSVSYFFGGTSMLIMVGVVLDTMRQVESHLLMRHYDGFLKKGKLHSRR